MGKTTVSLSCELEVEGKKIPLQTGAISSLPKGIHGAKGIEEYIKANLDKISFSSPKHWNEEFTLTELTNWLSKQFSITLPSVITNILNDMAFVINYFSISASGSFEISVTIDFTPPVTLKDIGLPPTLLALDNFGFALSHTPN